MILRELLLKLGLDVDAAAFAEGELAASVLKAGLEKVVEVAIEFAKEFAEAIEKTIEMGHEVEELAQRLGLETGELQNLTSAAGLAGVEVDTLSASLQFLARNMYHAKGGSEEAQKAFSALGIKYKDANGHLRSTSDVLLDLADRFKELPDGTQKTGEAMAILGKRGAQLIPMLNEGRDGMAELAAQSTNLTKEQIAASTEIVRAQRSLKAVVQNLWLQAIGPLLPTIRDLVKEYVEWRKENAKFMATKIREFVKGLLFIVKGLVEAFRTVSSVLQLMGDNMKIVSIFIGGLTAALVAMKAEAIAAAVDTAAAWVVAAAPFVAIGAAIGALLLIYDDLAVYLKGKGRSVMGAFNNMLLRWIQPQADDFWFVKGLKRFVAVMMYATKALREFASDVLAQFQSIADIIKYLPPVLIARMAYGAGEAIGNAFGDDENYDNAHAGARYTGKQNNAASGGFGPYAKAPRAPWGDDFGFGTAAPGGGVMLPADRQPSFRSPYQSTTSEGSGVLVQAPINMNVYQLPGEDTEAFTDKVFRVVDDHMQNTLKSAAAKRKKRE